MIYMTDIIPIIKTTDEFRNLSVMLSSAGMHMPWVSHCCWDRPTIFTQRRRPSPSAALAVVQPTKCEWWPQTTHNL